MRRSRRLAARHFSTLLRTPSTISTSPNHWRRQSCGRHHAALVRPVDTPDTPAGQIGCPTLQRENFASGQSKKETANDFGRLSQLRISQDTGRPGQARAIHRETILKLNQPFAGKREQIPLRSIEHISQLSDSELWEYDIATVRSHDIWEFFERLQKNGNLQMLAGRNAHRLRDEILSAALADDSRLSSLVEAARHLSSLIGFQWPNLYMKIIHHMLVQDRYEDSMRWHLNLAPDFPPPAEVFGALLSSFVVDPTPKMQSNLTALYVISTERQLYDHLVPVLFAAGLSKLARAWRRKLLLFRDVPVTAKSKPFLQFLATYYPSIDLVKEELAVAELGNHVVRKDDSALLDSDTSRNNGQLSDTIVARWFASSWISVEFAINLAQRLGLRVIGPRSLQSLALRESDAKIVASHIALIGKLGVAISSQAFCKALVFFAKHGEDLLLEDLLACDIHPDEFDDIETRQMLMAASVRDRDWRRERLLQGIEWAIESHPSTHSLNTLLAREVAKHKLGKTTQVLDRMEALKVSMNQESAVHLLQKTFSGLGKHPSSKKRQCVDSRRKFESLLNRAVDLIRRVALHDVAIPLRYWELLLYNLGRLGLLDELEHLSLEIVQIYAPPLGGLVPVHPEDLPHLLPREQDIRQIRSNYITPEGNPNDSVAPAPSPASSKHARHVMSLPSQILEMDGSLQCEQLHETWSGSLPDYSPLIAKPVSDSNIPCTRYTGVGLREHIPADLPFSHRGHPLQRLFDTNFQRSVVRWGFDQKITAAPSSITFMDTKSHGISAFDVASGVRLLALLRDQGVLIDPQVLRATVLSRIALGQIPGRQKDRSRDKHELSLEYMKALFDRAWGSEILPSTSEMAQHLETQKPKLWSRYPKLFGRSFDNRHKETSLTD